MVDLIGQNVIAYAEAGMVNICMRFGRPIRVAIVNENKLFAISMINTTTTINREVYL